MRFKFILAIILLITVLSDDGFGQNDSSTVKKSVVNFKDTPSPFLMYDRNFSFVESKLATTSGFVAGLEFSKRLKLGLGYSWLVNDVVENKSVITEAGGDTSLNAKLSMRMGVLYGEYIFYDKGNWQISMPVQSGIGTSYFTYYENVNQEIREKKLDQQGVWILTTTGMVTYRFLKWFGVSTGAGIRVMLVDNSSINQNLNGPIFTFKVRVFFGEIYKSIFPNGIKNTSKNN
jgi:hypothetical protein